MINHKNIMFGSVFSFVSCSKHGVTSVARYLSSVQPLSSISFCAVATWLDQQLSSVDLIKILTPSYQKHSQNITCTEIEFCMWFHLDTHLKKPIKTPCGHLKVKTKTNEHQRLKPQPELWVFIVSFPYSRSYKLKDFDFFGLVKLTKETLLS